MVVSVVEEKMTMLDLLLATRINFGTPKPEVMWTDELDALSSNVKHLKLYSPR